MLMANKPQPLKTLELNLRSLVAKQNTQITFDRARADLKGQAGSIGKEGEGAGGDRNTYFQENEFGDRDNGTVTVMRMHASESIYIYNVNIITLSCVNTCIQNRMRYMCVYIYIHIDII
jgi:hypothetical protein